MSDPGTILGECPDCDCEIRQVHLLIEYKTEDGTRAFWADCPECGKVVDPTE